MGFSRVSYTRWSVFPPPWWLYACSFLLLFTTLLHRTMHFVETRAALGPLFTVKHNTFEHSNGPLALRAPWAPGVHKWPQMALQMTLQMTRFTSNGPSNDAPNGQIYIMTLWNLHHTFTPQNLHHEIYTTKFTPHLHHTIYTTKFTPQHLHHTIYTTKFTPDLHHEIYITKFTSRTLHHNIYITKFTPRK